MEHMVPISEAKARLAELVRDSQDVDVYLLRHGRPVSILMGADRYAALLEELEDLADRISVYESRDSDPDLRVPVEKVAIELGLT